MVSGTLPTQVGTTPKKSAALPSASASTAWPCSSMASTISRSFFRTTFASCGSSHDEPANHTTVISNGAGRRLFFPLRSCEAVGPRSETSAPPSVFFCYVKSLFDFSDREYMTFLDAKQRFSNRVADYVRYRPSYPAAVLGLFRAESALST